jgi:hypothetical protein
MSFPIPIPTPTVGEIISFLKKPKLIAFIPKNEPKIQPIGNIRRAFYTLGVVNVSNIPIKKARVYLNFNGSEKVVSVKWDFKAEPFDSYTARNIVPKLIVDSQVQDLLPAIKETFAVLVKYEGENESYSFSAFSYLYPDFKDQRNKFDCGEYLVKANLVSENYRCSFSFKIKNIGKNFNDVCIEPLREYRGDKTYKPIQWE